MVEDEWIPPLGTRVRTDAMFTDEDLGTVVGVYGDCVTVEWDATALHGVFRSELNAFELRPAVCIEHMPLELIGTLEWADPLKTYSRLTAKGREQIAHVKEETR